MDQWEDTAVERLRQAEQAAWREVQRLGERVTTDRLRLPTLPEELARLREDYRRAHHAWRGMREALDRIAGRG